MDKFNVSTAATQFKALQGHKLCCSSTPAAALDAKGHQVGLRFRQGAGTIVVTISTPPPPPRLGRPLPVLGGLRLGFDLELSEPVRGH